MQSFVSAQIGLFEQTSRLISKHRTNIISPNMLSIYFSSLLGAAFVLSALISIPADQSGLTQRDKIMSETMLERHSGSWATLQY